MGLKKTVVLLALSLVISGCSILGPKKVEVITKPVEIEIVQPTLPRALDLKEPYWYVVSESNLDAFIENVSKQSGENMTFVAMTVADYELMAYNMQEIKRYVRELGEVIVYYRKVTIKDKDIEKEEKPSGNN